MQDYVARNWTDCVYYNGDRGCHETYHFADVAIQHDHYDRSYVGTSDHDIVSVINAAVDVLQGKPYPSPISIKDQKEALFVLAHLVGDLHQPLHVGSVYLDAQGKEVDPDVGQYDQATETIGGNKIFDGGKNFHAEWDAIPKYGSTTVDAIIGEAKAVPSTNGSVDTWAATWASDTIVQSQHAFDGATFEAEEAKGWPIDFASHSGHVTDEDKGKREQLAKGGARLAELLNAVWP